MAAVSLRYTNAVPSEDAYGAFGDEPAAVSYFEQVRWPGGPTCTRCGVGTSVRLPDADGRRWCSGCRRRFSVRTGTILAGGHAPLRAWAVGVVLTANGPFTVRPGALSRMSGVSAGAARTVADGIRSVCGSRVSLYDRPELLATRITEGPGGRTRQRPNEPQRTRRRPGVGLAEEIAPEPNCCSRWR